MKVDFYSLAKMDASADLNLNTNSRSIENGVWRQIYCLFTFLLLSNNCQFFCSVIFLFFYQICHPLFFLICLCINKVSCSKSTYFPWGNWDEREALRHCTWWWAGGSRPWPSCRALCRLCSETWPCRSLTGRTPWWPTQATGAHGPGTTTTGLQKDRRRRERKFIDIIPIVSGQTPGKTEQGEPRIWLWYKEGEKWTNWKQNFVSVADLVQKLVNIIGLILTTWIGISWEGWHVLHFR